MNEQPSAYETTIGPIEDRMVRLIWRITRDRHDAEDAMQNALATIWKRWQRVCRHACPRALILKICADAAYDVVRRRRNVEPARAEAPDPGRPPADELAGRETYAEVMAAIRRLSQQQATAVTLRACEELSYAEIGAALGCGEATARKHVERARAHLRVSLAHHEPNRTSRR